MSKDVSDDTIRTSFTPESTKDLKLTKMILPIMHGARTRQRKRILQESRNQGEE